MSSSYFAPGTFGMGDFTSDQADFRAVNRAARDAAMSGDTSGANGMFAQALAIYNRDPQVDPGSEQITYTQQIIAGDPQARADYAAGQQNLATAQANQPGIMDRLVGDVGAGSVANAWETAASWAQGFVYGSKAQPQNGKQAVNMAKGQAARSWGVPLVALGVGAWFLSRRK